MKLLKKIADSIYQFFKIEPTKEFSDLELNSILENVFGNLGTLKNSFALTQWLGNNLDSYHFIQKLNRCWSDILTTYSIMDIEISFELKDKKFDIGTERYIYQIDITMGGIRNQNCDVQFITKSDNRYHINCLSGESSHDTIDSVSNRIKNNLMISKMAFILLPFMPSTSRNLLGIIQFLSDYSVIQNGSISEFRLLEMFSEICPKPKISNGVISVLKEYNAFNFI